MEYRYVRSPYCSCAMKGTEYLGLQSNLRRCCFFVPGKVGKGKHCLHERGIVRPKTLSRFRRLLI